MKFWIIYYVSLLLGITETTIFDMPTGRPHHLPFSIFSILALFLWHFSCFRKQKRISSGLLLTFLSFPVSISDKIYWNSELSDDRKTIILVHSLWAMLMQIIRHWQFQVKFLGLFAIAFLLPFVHIWWHFVVLRETRALSSLLCHVIK